ncbi:MAG: GNAT family N-acetyltransferase [Saprospiraceae bacterium]
MNQRNLRKSIALRPIQSADFPFLQQVYASTRMDIQQAAGLTPAHKALLLQHQFNAQHSHYQKYFEQASFDIILFKKSTIGRLYVNRQLDEIRVVDISILPKFQKQGIGTFLLKNILAEGKKTATKVVLHVEQYNPALALYERLGFEKKKEVGTRFFMEWKS